MRCGVTTEHGKVAIGDFPPGAGDAESTEVQPYGMIGGAVDAEPDREHHEVLAVSPNAAEPVFEGAFRELVGAHGDQRGDEGYDVDELRPRGTRCGTNFSTLWSVPHSFICMGFVP